MFGVGVNSVVKPFSRADSFILDFGYEAPGGQILYYFIYRHQNKRHLLNLAPQYTLEAEEK